MRNLVRRKSLIPRTEFSYWVKFTIFRVLPTSGNIFLGYDAAGEAAARQFYDECVRQQKIATISGSAHVKPTQYAGEEFDELQLIRANVNTGEKTVLLK